MALLSELVGAVARVEGLPETFVAGIAKYLREAEHIRQGGRGLSAARMLSRDAAALLIGVNATRLAKDSIEAFEEYRGLKWLPNADDLPDDARLNVFRAVLKSDVTLVDALSKFIHLATWHDSFRPPLNAVFSKGELGLELAFTRPRKIVQLTIDDYTEKGFGTVFRGVFAGDQSEEPTSDRRDRVTISHRTILEVGEALSSD